MFSLEGKTCIVVGGGSSGDGVGTGAATAVVFARAGGRVLIADVSREAAEATRDTITSEGGIAETFVGDMTDPTTSKALAARAMDLWSRIDVLDNNIGIHGPGTVLEASDEEWHRVMTVNVHPMVLASRAVLPQMVRRGGGAIVNISASSATHPRGRSTPYATSKGAVSALTRAMAMDHAPEGIRVNSIAPGPIYTPMVSRSGMSTDLRARRRQASPLGIEGTAWDVAHAALFLASDEARYVTGISLRIDGGATINLAALGLAHS